MIINSLTKELILSETKSFKGNKGKMKNWNIKELFSPVQYQTIDVDNSIQAILFKNETYLGRPTEVFAYLGIPPSLEGQSSPGMVCVHGGGGTAFKEWVEIWVDRGYAAIAMDLSGRDGSGHRLATGGPEQDHQSKFSTTSDWENMWTYQAIAAVVRANTLLRDVPTVDPLRIGITGIRWGGYLTCIVSGVDSRFACAIPVYGCGFLQQNSASDWMQIFAAMSSEERQEWHDKCDPSVYLSSASMPMLFVSGTNDFAYPIDSLERSCCLPTGEITRCIRLEMPHSHEAGWNPTEIGIFADQHLTQGLPLPTIHRVKKGADLIRAEITSHSTIRDGYLLFTEDTHGWMNRKWQKVPAELINNGVEASIPDKAIACFLAIEDRRRAYVNTPYLDLNVE